MLKKIQQKGTLCWWTDVEEAQGNAMKHPVIEVGGDQFSDAEAVVPVHANAGSQQIDDWNVLTKKVIIAEEGNL